MQDLVGALGSFLALTDQGAPANGADIVTVGFNELLTSKWAADYQQFVPVTRAVAADTADGGRAAYGRPGPGGLFAAPAFTERREQRTKALADLHTEARADWARQAEEAKGRDRIHVSAAVDEIHRAVDEEWILTNTGSLTIDGWVKKLWPLERPGSYLGLNGGGGLGYGLGASIGAALAHQSDDTLCVDLQADGDFLYTPSALWTLAAYDVPLLVIVMNNRLGTGTPPSTPSASPATADRDIDRAHIATSFYDRPVDFVTLAQSFGVHTLPRVEHVDAVAPTVREAVAHIKEHGRPVLVEILME